MSPKQTQGASDINLHELLFLPDLQVQHPAMRQYSTIHILAPKNGVLQSYNWELLETIKKLDSYNYIDVYPDVYTDKVMRQDQK
jgi:hypothetical protein